VGIPSPVYRRQLIPLEKHVGAKLSIHTSSPLKTSSLSARWVLLSCLAYNVMLLKRCTGSVFRRSSVLFCAAWFQTIITGILSSHCRPFETQQGGYSGGHDSRDDKSDCVHLCSVLRLSSGNYHASNFHLVHCWILTRNQISKQWDLTVDGSCINQLASYYGKAISSS
jgi:hypothetical protein